MHIHKYKHTYTHKYTLSLTMCMLLLRKSLSLLSKTLSSFRTQVSISSTFYAQLLLSYVPKEKKTHNLTVFLRIWDMCVQKRLLKCWWNWPQLCTMYNVVVHVCFAITQPLKSFSFKKSQKDEIAMLKGSMASTICSLYLLFFFLNLLSF